jgi:hypothetical protein
MSIDFSGFISFLQDKKSLLLVFNQKQVDLDFLAFLTSFSLLKENNEINLSLLSNYLPSNSDKNIFGWENIAGKLPKENLVLSFDYDQKQVDKITYQIDEESNKFLLTIKPQIQIQPLDFRKISYSYSGQKTNGIIFCDIDNINSLGRVYYNYKEELSLKENVFYLNSKIKKNQKTNNYLDLEDLSWSEFLVNLITKMEYKFDKKIATNLIAGIDFKTKNMANVSNGETFEAMAKLLKEGGERKIFGLKNSLNKNKEFINNSIKKENKIKDNEKIARVLQDKKVELKKK